MLGPRGREGAVLSDTGKNDAEPMTEKEGEEKKTPARGRVRKISRLCPLLFLLTGWLR
jgi:hypothetical protein